MTIADTGLGIGWAIAVRAGDAAASATDAGLADIEFPETGPGAGETGGTAPGVAWGTNLGDMERLSTLAGRALIVVVDDRVAHGDHEDEAGPLVHELLAEDGFIVDGTVVVSSDEVEIRKALNTAVIGGVDLVVSVGGTGASPRDVTPAVTSEILDMEIPGIAEALRSSALSAGSVEGGISRGVAGVSGSTLVVNLAGTRESLRDGMATLSRLARHIIGELSGIGV